VKRKHLCELEKADFFIDFGYNFLV